MDVKGCYAAGWDWLEVGRGVRTRGDERGKVAIAALPPVPTRAGKDLRLAMPVTDLL